MWRSVVLSAMVGLCLSCAPLKEAGELRTGTAAEVAPIRQVALGLGEDYPEAARKLGTLRRDLEVIKTNGLGVLRISFPWDAMEPEAGRYEWDFWDQLVRLATEEYGLRLVPYVCYTPRWAAQKQSEDFWRQPPQDPARFGAFLARLVSRYRAHIHSWELWNEPDNPEYWSGSIEQFAELLRAGSQAVRQADPLAKIVMGGLAWNLGFLKAMLTNSAAMREVDVVNLHNYYETWSSDALERLPEYVGRAHDLLRQFGQHQPLWMAEIGYSSYRRDSYVSYESQAFYQYEHTPEHQAASLFRALSLLLASGQVSLVTWYRLNDLPSTQEVIGDVNNRHLGLLTENGQPKPALRALAYFHSLFGSGFRCLDDQVRIAKPLRSDAEVHAFQRPDGKVVVVGWLRTVVPGTRGSEPRGQAVDRRRERLELVLPFAAEGMAERFDELGRWRGFWPVASGDGQARLRALELGGGGVTVWCLRPTNRAGAGKSLSDFTREKGGNRPVAWHRPGRSVDIMPNPKERNWK